MLRNLAISILSASALISIPLAASAKVETVKIVVSGPDLAKPVEISDLAKLGKNANAFGIPFVDANETPIDDVSPTPVPPYEVKLYGDYGDDGVRANFVVYFAWDASQRRARVYFPARSDPWWPLNASTILLPAMEGHWYYADEQWGKGIYDAIYRVAQPY